MVNKYESYKDFVIEDNMIMKYLGKSKDIVIPEGITDIFFEVFYGLNFIENVTIPGTILDITPYEFEASSLKELIINEGVEIINFSSFNECKKLEVIYLPKSLKVLKKHCFANCVSLKTIYYNGTQEQWNQINKDSLWDENTKDYEIIYVK